MVIERLKARRLRLQPSEALHGADDAQVAAPEQQLPREQRAVQLPPREHALGHPATLPE